MSEHLIPLLSLWWGGSAVQSSGISFDFPPASSGLIGIPLCLDSSAVA